MSSKPPRLRQNLKNKLSASSDKTTIIEVIPITYFIQLLIEEAL